MAEILGKRNKVDETGSKKEGTKSGRALLSYKGVAGGCRGKIQPGRGSEEGQGEMLGGRALWGEKKEQREQKARRKKHWWKKCMEGQRGDSRWEGTLLGETLGAMTVGGKRQS